MIIMSRSLLLLFSEYDPNPLLSLGKRRRQMSSSDDKRFTNDEELSKCQHLDRCLCVSNQESTDSNESGEVHRKKKHRKRKSYKEHRKHKHKKHRKHKHRHHYISSENNIRYVIYTLRVMKNIEDKRENSFLINVSPRKMFK